MWASKFIIIAIALALIIAPLAHAQEVLGNTDTGGWTFQRLKDTANYLVDWALRVLSVVAFGAIIWYGIKMTISRGDAAAFTAAKDGLIKACIGAAVIFGVYTIIATVQNAVQNLPQ